MVSDGFVSDISLARINSLYRSSSEGLTSVLSEYGWVELSLDSTPDELNRTYEMLAYILPALSSGHSSRNDVSFKFPILNAPPSYLQFFFDLFSLGEPDTPYNEVLVSYLHLEDSGSQEYELYDCDSLSSIQFLLESIRDSPALIFPGRFQFSQGDSGPILNTRRANQRTVNGFCVDLDPSNVGSDDLPLDPSVLLHLLKNSHPGLRPSYICLSGRGVHLWYIFDRPVQTFRSQNPRRQKLQALSRSLYSYFEILTEDLPCILDSRCSALNHGFRAPGSLTKRGYPVRCFCPQDKVFGHSVINPYELSVTLSSLSDLMSFDYPPELRVDASDIAWKSFSEMKRELDLIRTRPATDSQLEFIHSLFESGFISDREYSRSLALTSPQAGELIGRALERRDIQRSASNRYPNRPGWRTRPHSFIAGSSGGIYNVVLDNIQKVPLGRRYLSLHMLAGVAYMMVNPVKTKGDLERDMLSLLETPWAKAGTPLSNRDVRNALLGYTANNWQTRNSIVSTLGFDPFGDPAKRNGRSRSDHLTNVANPARIAILRKRNLSAIIAALEEDPRASKRSVAKMTGISYPTVIKYWKEACRELGIEDTRSGNHRK